ncbi:MAG: DNA repair protein RadC [Kiritimatiellia bacterium]
MNATENAKNDGRRMAEIPEGDRPREKLLRLGVRALTDDELLAILLRTGIKGCNVHQLAHALRVAVGEFPTFRRYDHQSLVTFIKNYHDPVTAAATLRGIGPDKLATLLAALEIGARAYGPTQKELHRPILRPGQVAEIMFAESSRYLQEGFWALLLDHRRAPLGEGPELLTLGVGDHTVINPPTLFRKAVMLGAHAVILVHNHPSGAVTPSDADIATTEKLIVAGRVIGIPIADHIIVGRPDCSPSYYSFRSHERCSF